VLLCSLWRTLNFLKVRDSCAWLSGISFDLPEACKLCAKAPQCVDELPIALVATSLAASFFVSSTDRYSSGMSGL